MADLVGQTLGNYRIEGQLGAGGMGEVYRAVHTKLDRPAAIKILHSNQAADPTFQARFLREARAAAALSHPNIVEVFDFGEEDGASYLVMELVPDGSLRTLLRQRAKGEGWTLGLGIDLVRQAAEGLAYAHAAGMVHRDIKPDNLLLQRIHPLQTGADADETEQYQLKISDFGLARLVDDTSELTATGMVMGTPTYMSPEQCQGADLDGRSDLYSLGVVLYEVATGTPPFRVKTLSEAVFKHISATPTPPREIQPDLPPALEDVILRCLEKDPEQRIASGAELAQELNGILGGAEARTIVTPRNAVFGASTPSGSSMGGATKAADSRTEKKTTSATPAAQRSAAPPRYTHESDDDATIRATATAGAAPRASATSATSSTDKPPSRKALGMGVGGVIAAVVLVLVLLFALSPGLRSALANFGKSATPTPQPTVTATPTPADKIVFQDAMSKPSSQWAQSARSYFSDGGFEINGAWLVFSPANALSNGTVSVRLRQVGGVDNQFYGLVIRAQNNASYYVFGLSESQQWTFQRVTNGAHTMVVAPTTDTHIKRGPNASNTISVKMRGSHFTFYVNGVQIGQADDAAYASGTVGLVNIVGRLQVVYNDFTVAVPVS